MTAFSVATWNINSVRLRIKLVQKYLKTKEARHVLCLQETKCPNDLFPLKPLAKMGYEFTALHGQKGYHGVAILSRLPIDETHNEVFCDKDDCRHVAIRVTPEGAEPVEIHNFLCACWRGMNQTPIRMKSSPTNYSFSRRMTGFSNKLRKKEKKGIRQIVVGDLNVAPLEHDVWSHKQMLKIVSHTPQEVERFDKILSAGAWADITRAQYPEPDKVYSWWSYRAKDWAASNRGRRLDHIWTGEKLAKDVNNIELLTAARGWEQPSDHIPILAEFELS